MRRFLVLILALTFCLFGCKEETPEKPVEKITEEVKEPIEETKTPVENVEVPEVEEPVEEIDESKTIVVLDFPYEPYVEPEIVSPEQFQWGEYFPLISYTNGEIENPGWVGLYKYRFFDGVLSNEVTTLQEAVDLYDLLKSNISQTETDNGNSISSLLEETDYNREIYETLEFIDQNGTKLETFLKEIIDNKRIIFEAINHNNFYLALFSYNIETKESDVLTSFAYDCSLSPDGKYLAYSSPARESYDIADISDHFGSNVLSMKKGFYVKNLENGQTTFYSCDGYCSREIGIYDSEEICIDHSMWWISKDNYEKLKEKQE